MNWVTDNTYNIIETVEYRPQRLTRVKKMIWSDEDKQFRTHYFLRVTCDNLVVRDEAVRWLTEQFGPGGYQKSWWQEPQNSLMLWMADSLATFWQLKYGDRS